MLFRALNWTHAHSITCYGAEGRFISLPQGIKEVFGSTVESIIVKEANNNERYWIMYSA